MSNDRAVHPDHQTERDELPDGQCPACGQVTFGGKHPELTIEYDGDEVSTRMCEECISSPFDVVKWIQKNGGIKA